MSNRNPHDPNLPLGYRWANEDETEAWGVRGFDLLGQQWVHILYDNKGSLLPKEQREEKWFDLAVLDDRNLEILRHSLETFDKVDGPRVGDYVEFSDDVVRRFTHKWEGDVDYGLRSGLQTTDDRFGSQSFHLGDGYVSYSGSLRPLVPAETLSRKDEIRLGWVWFWHHDHSGASRGVDVKVPLRVYTSSLSSEDN